MDALNCKDCGHTATVRELPARYWVWCEGCGTLSPIFRTRMDALNHWNFFSRMAVERLPRQEARP